MTKVQLKSISLYDLLTGREELITADAINAGDIPEYIVKALDWVESHYDEKQANAVASTFTDNVESSKCTSNPTIQLGDLGKYTNEMGMTLSQECNIPSKIQVEVIVPTQTETNMTYDFRDGWIIIKELNYVDESGTSCFYPNGTKTVAKIIYAGPVTLWTDYEKTPDGLSPCHYSISFPESGYNGPDNEIDFGKCQNIIKKSECGTDTITFDFTSVDETENRPDDLVTILEICDCIDY